MIKMLSITRKYPPQTGGMENMSYHLLNGLDDIDEIKQKKIVLGRKQIHLIWFIPYCIMYLIFNAHKYDVIFIGDAVLSILGIICKIFSKSKVIVNAFGLDLTYSNRIYQLYLKLLYKKSFDYYIPISKDTAQLLEQRGIYNYKIINPGIDTEMFDGIIENKKEWHEKNGIDDGSLVLFTVGRLVRRKGVAWFVENVIPELKDLPYIYCVAGTGPDEEYINNIIMKKNLSDKIKMLGRISDQDLKELYVNADIFVMPNITVPDDKEGFGIVACEASLSKNIVLASNIEGIKDAIIDGENGHLLRSKDTKEYVDIIRSLIIEKGFDKDTEKYVAYTKKHYSWSYICNEYYNLIKELL